MADEILLPLNQPDVNQLQNMLSEGKK